MKFFAIFAAIMALASANGIYELSEAIQNPNTDPAMIPYLEAALNELMTAAITQPIQPAPIAEPSVDVAAIDQLLDAIHNPATDPAMLPFLEAALNELLAPINNPLQPIPIVTVPVTPTVLTSWSLQELSDAIENPNTDPALLPYLEDGLNALMSSLMAGEQQESIIIALPSDLAPISTEVSPVTPGPINPGPVLPSPVIPVPVETPLAPEAASSPLVQIIVNVNSQASAPAPVVQPPPTPVAQPTPAPVVEWVAPPRPVPEQTIVPVQPIKPPQAIINPIDVPEVNPIDVIAIAAPETSPSDIIGVTVPEVNPIDVIAIGAPETNPIGIIGVAVPEINPIDVIAVGAPETNPVGIIGVAVPEINPIDILHPLPVAVGAAVVGPLM